MIQTVAITYNNERITNVPLEALHADTYRWWWIDFYQPNKDEITLLETELHFHPLAVEDCIQGNQRPKLDYYDDFSFFVTHTIGPQHFNQFEINFFIGECYIVTFHKKDLQEINDVWNQLFTPKNVLDWDEHRVFYEIMDNVVDNYFPIIYRLEDRINAVENNPDNETMHVLLENLFDLRHELLELRHAINPIRDLFYRILNSHHLEGIQERRAYFTDIYDHLLKLSEMIYSNRELTNDIRDNFISINSYQQNKVIQILTVITSIFAPLTFIVGIYGMNFVHMPELQWQYGYLIIWILMSIITILMILWFKKKGWFG
ncbi:magnesium/cobalt transporter CorA [Virgibacillus sp. MG-45]|uniref:magnesium/cobalt transporter CorA n=1 Tax=Virgibacillus sp. MG-45 TaxID=3102791 RepID=UPI002ED93E6D